MTAIHEVFALTPAAMLRVSDPGVIAGDYDLALAGQASALAITAEDHKCLRQIGHLLIALAGAERDAGKPEAFKRLQASLEPERWTNYLDRALLAQGQLLPLPFRIAASELLDAWDYEEARRLGLLLKPTFCVWLAGALES